MKQAFITKNFSEVSEHRIAQAEGIIEEYQAAGYSLTLRQLYYQFVARDLLPNSQKSYNNLGSLIADARLAGYIDWDAIEDRTRNLRSVATWETGSEILHSCSQQFRLDRWLDQPYYVEVWIEKDALIGVIEKPCRELGVPYFACRGYNSQSEMYAAGRRLKYKTDGGYQCIVLHLGDHDPSGVDMTRDNQERLQMFAESTDIEVKRIALNWDQIEEYDPPPNPAKLSDSRARDYIRKYGRSSWELDALDPTVIDDLIRAELDELIEPFAWQIEAERESAVKKELHRAADEFRGKRL